MKQLNGRFSWWFFVYACVHYIAAFVTFIMTRKCCVDNNLKITVLVAILLMFVIGNQWLIMANMKR